MQHAIKCAFSTGQLRSGRLSVENTRVTRCSPRWVDRAALVRDAAGAACRRRVRQTASRVVAKLRWTSGFGGGQIHISAGVAFFVRLYAVQNGLKLASASRGQHSLAAGDIGRRGCTVLRAVALVRALDIVAAAARDRHRSNGDRSKKEILHFVSLQVCRCRLGSRRRGTLCCRRGQGKTSRVALN